MVNLMLDDLCRKAGVGFEPRLMEYKTSKGAIQFPNSRELPLELIAEIARWSWETNKK
jgi:uncharacterized protein YdhG (YjbR/CyaY superfamily)